LKRSIEALRGAYDCVLVGAPSPAVSRVAQVLARSADVLVVVADSEDGADALRAALLPGTPDPVVVRSGIADEPVAAAG
jgi:hypothetical protein